ncbi:hypothetical protein D3C74_415790 [compost metagenome]
MNVTVILLLALSNDTVPVLEDTPLYTLPTDFSGSLNSTSTFRRSVDFEETTVGASVSTATSKSLSTGTTFKPEKS